MRLTLRCNFLKGFKTCGLVILLGALAPQARADTGGAIADFLSKPSLNVVITVEDMDASVAFYRDVLGLEQIAPVHFGANTAPVFFPTATKMERFRVGTHEIKLIPGVESTKSYPRGLRDGIGLRMVNYPIADVAALKERLKQHGYPEPSIGELPGSNYRFGLIEDPEGNIVEFYYYDGQGPPNWQESIQIALTVSDVEASRLFYGETLGMQGLPPVPMPGDPGREVHIFMNGPTMIKFWSHGKDLPNRAGRHLDVYGYRYIQYQTNDIHATHRFVKSGGATMDLPPTAVASMPVDIMFVADPDGIVNEMFGMSVGASEAGFTPLFNGRDLSGWVGDTEGYVVENGELVCRPGGNLFTAKDFDDFILRFEFKLTPGANNGLGIRAASDGKDAAYDAIELQILENTASKYDKLKPYQYHGSVYGVVPALRGHLRPVGEWNEQEVIAKGNDITVILNGTTIVDADIKRASEGGTMDGQNHPGLLRPSGRIGFLGHGDVLYFRNIRIMSLD